MTMSHKRAEVTALPSAESHDPAFHYLMMKSSLDQFGIIYSELKPEQWPQVTRTATHARQLQRIVLASPEASQVHLTGQEIEQAVASLQQRFDKEESFIATLAANQLEPVGLRKALRDELHCEAILNYIGLQVEAITDSQVADYYQANSAKFAQPERRYARHILITVNDDFVENTLDQVEIRIADIERQLRKKSNIGSHFGWFAKRHSECPSAMNDGELGWVEQATLFAELDDALFGMTAGEMSPPIATEVGLHLLYCQEINPAHVVTFEQAKDKIRQGLQQQASKQAQKQWLKALSAD
ncbi:nitrogen fixation protein NifM [Neiella marina]|uniref:peptidylprolyl isomerase n=1 Tax=Neiella holothuriorum TaxID=2870530 RepID=A0ABS7EL18_9GAMM|nr:nitrogen fixation protein NifM [Neiella holothuriorum]MBW8192578.1 nitrogen fixation protein NifM [Neiella holothuriorum]